MWLEIVTNPCPSPHGKTKKRGRTARDTRPNIAGETGGEIKVPICTGRGNSRTTVAMASGSNSWFYISLKTNCSLLLWTGLTKWGALFCSLDRWKNTGVWISHHIFSGKISTQQKLYFVKRFKRSTSHYGSMCGVSTKKNVWFLR